MYKNNCSLFQSYHAVPIRYNTKKKKEKRKIIT